MENTNISIGFSSFVAKRCDFTHSVIDSSSRAMETGLAQYVVIGHSSDMEGR